MTIKKYLHSCILLEENGKRLLIDPGSFSFIERKITPRDIGAVDAILITHSHQDHYFPEALKEFVKMNPALRIIASADIVELLKNENLDGEAINSGETKNIGGVAVKAIALEHGNLPILHPHNFGFIINNKFFHPGDSISRAEIINCDVLALPVSAPWAKWIDLLDFGRDLKPKIIIPIHEKVYAEYFIPRVMQISKEYIEKFGIQFKSLEIGDVLEI